MAATSHHGYGHSRSRSEPFSVAHLTNPEPPPLPTQQPQHQNIATQPIAISPKEDNEGSANGDESPDKGDGFNGAPKKTESEKKKPFKCDRAGCGMAFSRQEHLLRHIRFVTRILGPCFLGFDNLIVLVGPWIYFHDLFLTYALLTGNILEKSLFAAKYVEIHSLVWTISDNTHNATKGNEGFATVAGFLR